MPRCGMNRNGADVEIEGGKLTAEFFVLNCTL